MGDRIEVPLGLDDVEVLGSELVGGVLEVVVQSVLAPRCVHCGSSDVIGHGRRERRIRDVPCGRPVVLVWVQRRWRCRGCDRTFRERHPMVQGAKRATVRLRRRLFERACAHPFSDVAADHGVSPWRVVDAFDEHAEVELANRVIDRLRVVAIDESSFARPFRYQSVLFDPVGHRPIEMAPDRQRESVVGLLNGLDPQVRAGIETVVIDMWRPFRDAVRCVLGDDVRIVVDRFHVQRSVDRAAQKVRTRLSYRQPPTGPDGLAQSRFTHRRYDPRAFNARFAFAARHHRLDQRRRSQLDELFAAYPDIGVAWLMKEAFAAIYDATDRTDAEARLDTWVHNLDAAGLPELHAIWRSIRRWRSEILAYFDDPQTNAFAEGFTNRIKVMKRRGYGYRHPGRYRARVLLCNTPRTT